MRPRAELLKAIVVLPGTVLVLIPGVLLYLTRPVQFLFGIQYPEILMLVVAGSFFLITGILGSLKTVSLFMTAGEGTPAPWAPPKHFVVRGPYAFVRNPMILSVIFILLGEAFFLGSIPIVIWCLLFWILNTVYFIYFEEPGLLKRFGGEYEEYKKHVRRWIPRLTPWHPASSSKFCNL